MSLKVTLPTWQSDIEFFVERLRRRIRENETSARVWAARADLGVLERALEVERCDVRRAAYESVLDDAMRLLVPRSQEQWISSKSG